MAKPTSKMQPDVKPSGKRPSRTTKPEQGSAPGPSSQAIPAEIIGENIQRGMEAMEQSQKGASDGSLFFSNEPGRNAQNILALQQIIGNRSVQNMLQRQPTDPGTPTTTPAADAALPEDLQTFRSGGPYPTNENGTTVAPPTGMGGFNARYDPSTMVLTITVNIGMNFIDGMRIVGNQVEATESSMDPSAVRINRILSTMSDEQRATALDQVRQAWQWTGPTDPRIDTWMASYRSSVTTAWSSAGTGIVFQGSRTGWESQLANVNVVVNTANITSLERGAPIPGPQPVHCQASIYKTPDADVFGANVAPGTGESATDQYLSLGSGQVVAQSHLLNQSVLFDNDSAELNSDAQDRLTRWVISFQSPEGTAGSSISIVGHASSTGQATEAGRRRNRQLAAQRAEAVRDFLRTTAVEGNVLRNAEARITSVTNEGAEGATEDESWRRVDIAVAGGEGQNIAAHEFGHMIGLGDEYASTPQRDDEGNIVHDANNDAVTRGLISGTGGDVGEATEHNTLATEMGLGGSVYENNDNIMSLGSTVRPQHYATFMKALRDVTSINDWRLRS